VESWIRDISNKAKSTIFLAIVGNKSDLDG
jgi:hypothetical protein